VVGAGAIGQLILQLVLNAGAGERLVVETSRLRREVARACGAAQARLAVQLLAWVLFRLSLSGPPRPGSA
jgi:threonine dehydrogenase-like Zn-dependent dehydrogenase